MSITDSALVRKLLPDKGMQYMFVSTLCFSAMQTLVRLMPQFSGFEHVFFRSLIGWLICAGVLRAQGLSLIGKNSRLLLYRGLIGSVSMVSFFYILPRIPFGSSVTLKYLSPIFTAVFAVVLLREVIRPVQWLFFGISFGGVLLLKGFDPRIGLLDLGIGLLSSVAGGLLVIVIKKIGDDDHPLVILHYFMAMSTLAGGLAMIPVWHTPGLTDLAGFLLIGVVGFFAQNFFTKSIQASAQVSSLANMRYLEAAYALLIGYALFGETYTPVSFLGIVLIFAGLLLSLRFKAVERRRAMNVL
jgi:drug/metabolite transporter (DMT)-like permease